MSEGNPRRLPRIYVGLTCAAAVVGLLLMADSLRRSSATYDEVAYMRVACRWWTTGDQEPITRMGSPLTFWKLQQAPTLWLLDLAGRGPLIREPEVHQAELLPILRTGSLWIWILAFGLTAIWAGRLYGPRAMSLAAWLFALSPNLLAHGALITMELPLVAATTGVGLLFTISLRKRDTKDESNAFTASSLAFWGAAALSGLAFSCKFTAILIPPIYGLCLLVRSLHDRQIHHREVGWLVVAVRVLRQMAGFLLVMVLANWVVTGFAILPISERVGDHPSLGTTPSWLGRIVEAPIPQDWVGFLTQIRHQRSGGPSYLFGERRMTGWWYYYFVTMAVKVPPTFWLLVAGRLTMPRKGGTLFLLAIAAFLTITAAGSSRNYGFRYVLPVAPLAIVWVSALAEASRRFWLVAMVGLLGQLVAVATIHPGELSYFNVLANGPKGGRRVLADSNLDWGQGLRGLVSLQTERPEFRDLTLYYFGDTEPAYYGVHGRSIKIDASDIHPGLPDRFRSTTRFVAVSSSLQFGPWGPPGYFGRLAGVTPVIVLDDATIAIYATADLASEPDQ
ncbi:MAG: family glycosyltransferase, 4-amino-4-deoxy-L-arabinose transferase [Planctomycetota bacterium]|nr:family glycosyltransferase, 4-amino-4-deoxy-L-arabinose transferase [Planctomycetota bacterium]